MDEPQQASASSSFSIEKIVGVWRDFLTGERLVAVVWEDEEDGGGTWEDFSTLQMRDFAPSREPGVDSDDDGAVQKGSNDEDSQGGSHWNEWFGSQLPKGKQLMVQWVDDQDSTITCESLLGTLAGD